MPSGKRNARSAALGGNNVSGKGNSAVNAVIGRGIAIAAGTVTVTETAIGIVIGIGAGEGLGIGPEVGTGASVGTPRTGMIVAAPRM